METQTQIADQRLTPIQALMSSHSQSLSPSSSSSEATSSSVAVKFLPRSICNIYALSSSQSFFDNFGSINAQPSSKYERFMDSIGFTA